jgi:hypothetical protein
LEYIAGGDVQLDADIAQHLGAHALGTHFEGAEDAGLDFKAVGELSTAQTFGLAVKAHALTHLLVYTVHVVS